jgi:hypothetical protein
MKWIKKVATTPIDAVAKVIDTLQTQTNERLNAPSIRAVRDGLADKWQDIYPIGSIYMSVNDTNPSLVFGGTWQQIKDRFLLASGDTYNNGQTGGSTNITPTGTVNNHTLTLKETPVHKHSTQMRVESQNLVVGSGSQSGVPYDFYIKDGNNYTATGDAYNNSAEVAIGEPHNHGLTMNQHTNMPPYLAVNVWVRTA